MANVSFNLFQTKDFVTVETKTCGKDLLETTTTTTVPLFKIQKVASAALSMVATYFLFPIAVLGSVFSVQTVCALGALAWSIAGCFNALALSAQPTFAFYTSDSTTKKIENAAIIEPKLVPAK